MFIIFENNYKYYVSKWYILMKITVSPPKKI